MQYAFGEEFTEGIIKVKKLREEDKASWLNWFYGIIEGPLSILLDPIVLWGKMVDFVSTELTFVKLTNAMLYIKDQKFWDAFGEVAATGMQTAMAGILMLPGTAVLSAGVSVVAGGIIAVSPVVSAGLGLVWGMAKTAYMDAFKEAVEIQSMAQDIKDVYESLLTFTNTHDCIKKNRWCRVEFPVSSLVKG